MGDTNQLGVIWVIVLPFVSMFICASLLRAKGVTGLLALTGIVSVGVVVFMDLQDWRLAVGAISALVGLVLGGQVSDRREHQRVIRLQEEENRKRDALMRR